MRLGRRAGRAASGPSLDAACGGRRMAVAGPVAAGPSFRTRTSPRGDRLLWAWSVAPLVLVSVASARNAHYAIYALVPWSIWAALGLARLGTRLLARGFTPMRLGGWAVGSFTVLGLAYGLGFWLLGPRLAHRGAEWAFYDAVGRQLPVREPLVLLYDDWDRDPYPTPFGPIPHDLAVRLYYLNRPACWHFKFAQFAAHLEGSCAQGTQGESNDAVFVIGRQRDVPDLERLGRVEILAQGPSVRWDRTYLLARVRPPPHTLRSSSRAGPAHRTAIHAGIRNRPDPTLPVPPSGRTINQLTCITIRDMPWPRSQLAPPPAPPPPIP